MFKKTKQEWNLDFEFNILAFGVKYTQVAFTCSNSTMERLEKDVKYVQS